MKREYVDYTIQKLKCVPNGSKEACVKVREYLQNIQLNRKIIQYLPMIFVALVVKNLLTLFKHY